MLRPTVRNGKLTFNGPLLTRRFEEWLQRMEGKVVELSEVEPGRSISQNRMYRAWLNSTATHTGNNAEELHEFLLQKCAPRHFVTIKGARGSLEVEHLKRSSDMSKQEMSEFMDKCSALTGYPLPTPEELEAMGYVSNHKPMQHYKMPEHDVDVGGGPTF